MAADDGRYSLLLPARDSALFYEQLGRCLKSGLPVGRSLRELASGAGSTRLRRALAEATAAVEAGQPVGESLGHHPALFPAHEAGYMSLAEAAGRLPAACEELGRQHRARHERGQRLRAKMAYPLAMLGIAVLALPLRHLVTGDTDAYMQAVTPALLALGLSLVGGALAVRLPAAQGALVALGHRLPVVRPWLEQSALAQFVRSLSHAYAAGLSADRAVRLAATGLRAGELKRAASAVAGRLGRGGELAAAMAAHPRHFSGRLLEAVRTGELTGTLDQSLLAAADELDAEAQRAAERALVLAGGALSAAVIGYVAWQIVSQGLAQVRQVQEQLEL